MAYGHTEEQIDLQLAAQLQAALLPGGCPHGCPHQQAAARNRMCGSVGGDFYDFIKLNSDQYAITIGDVIGHGIRAALIMAQISGFLRSRAEDRGRPAEIVRQLNRLLIDLGRRTDSVVCCSLLYAVLDEPSGVGFLVNAGHPYPFLCDKESCSVLSLEEHNILLGVEDMQPTEVCLTFRPGQRLVLFTDGLTDAVNSHREPFGYQRLHAALNAHADDPPQRCVDGIFQAIDAFRGNAAQSDDETIVVIDRI